jgi:hypothetical protein
MGSKKHKKKPLVADMNHRDDDAALGGPAASQPPGAPSAANTATAANMEANPAVPKETASATTVAAGVSLSTAGAGGTGDKAQGPGRSATFGTLPGCQLSCQTLGVLHGLGFSRPTPVQAAVIPLFVGNKVGCCLS